MKTTTPYEFLVRIKPDGTISGAHVKYLDTYTDDVTGAVIQQVEGDAQPVAMAIADKGFPIAAILSTIQAAALATLDVERMEHTNAIAVKDATIAALQAAPV